MAHVSGDELVENVCRTDDELVRSELLVVGVVLLAELNHRKKELHILLGVLASHEAE